MKALPSICKENKEFIGKIADILAQLLQLNDPQEYNIACTSLLQVLQEDPITVIKCIYKQINLLEMGNVRAKCIKFLTTKIKTLDKALYTTELEDVIIEETKKTLQVLFFCHFFFISARRPEPCQSCLLFFNTFCFGFKYFRLLRRQKLCVPLCHGSYLIPLIVNITFQTLK